MKPAYDGGSPAGKIRYHLDRPTSWVFHPSSIIIAGWCCDENDAAPREIRAKIGRYSYPGVTGLPRPDVAAAAAGPTASGFEIRAPIAVGDVGLAIEARWDSNWVGIDSRRFSTRRHVLPTWLSWGNSESLLAFQFPAHATHPPLALRHETYPPPGARDVPKLSIVTPSFNQAPYLLETIDSVAVQRAVLEYVVQDGGSTDGSVELIASRASRLKAWESRKDDGQADAIQRGFEKTNGNGNDLMGWINSDDFYLPGSLDFIADFFGRNPEIDVVYGHRVLVDAQSQEIGRWFLPRHDSEILKLNDFVPQETVFWRRRIWEKSGGLDKSFRFAMDWDLLLRFSAAGARIVRVPYFLACFRIHASQKTAATMHSIGQSEIDQLRQRTFGRKISPREVASVARLHRYLRKSAWIQWLWERGFRAR